MSELKLGITLPQFSGDVAQLLDAALEAEALGLDSLWAFDHLWPLSGGKERPILEGWTTLAWLASKTERIGIGTLVTRSSLRHPAVLAKMAATVACVAPGRLTVAVGSGDRLSREENEAFGLEYHEGEERADQLRSTVEVLHRSFSAPAVDQDDDFVTLRNLPLSPRPPQAPPIWVAGRSTRVIEIAGDLADGWNAWQGSPARYARDLKRVRERAGDRPLEPSWGGILMLGRDDAEASERMAGRDPAGFLVGGPETVAAKLQPYVDAGARHLTLTLGGPWSVDGLRLFARDVRAALSGAEAPQA